jgi:hypothetical protein
MRLVRHSDIEEAEVDGNQQVWPITGEPAPQGTLGGQ